MSKFKFNNKVNGKFVKLSLNAKIRQMYAAGYSHTEIAKALETKYQRVRNVVGARCSETAIIAVDDSFVNRELVEA